MIDYGYCQSEACWGDAWMLGADVETTMQGIKAVGGSRVRIGVQVGTVADTDRAVNLAIKYGLKPLLCILGNPAFGYSSNSTAAFAAECTAVATRYGPAGFGTVTEYELWNESNNTFFNGPGVDASTHVGFLRAGYTAIKAVHSSSTVISGGTVPTSQVGGGFFPLLAVDPVQWYTAIYAAGGKQYFDALGFHLYVDASPSLPSMTDPHVKFLTDVRALMVANGDAAKQIWITEVGVEYPGFAGISTASQARDILKAMIDIILSLSYCGPFFIYNYRNSTAAGDSGENGNNLGIVSYKFQPRVPIYDYAATIASSGGPGTVVDTTPPSSPTSVMISIADVTDTTAPVAWGPSTDNVSVTDYRVYRDTGVKLADAPAANTLLTGLTPGTSYSIYVTAVDAAGNESAPSLTKTFTTAAPSGTQSFDAGMFAGSTVPIVFSQLGLGFTVAGGVALPNPSTVNGSFYTIAPFTTNKQTADHSMRVSLAGMSTANDRFAMAVIRCSADGQEWAAAVSSGGTPSGRADSLRIITCSGGTTRVRAAMTANPGIAGQELEIAAEGSSYTARLLDATNSVLFELPWTDLKGVYKGAANLRTALAWHHKRVGGVNYPPPGITGWKASDQNAVQAASGAIEPWMYAIVDMDDWAELAATGSWQTLISSRKLAPAAPGPSVPPTTPPVSPFVTRDPSTGNLMYGGQRYRFGGANTPFIGLIGSAPAAVAGEAVLADGYHYASHAQIDATLAAAQAFNSNVITSWGAVQSVGTSSSVQPTLGVFNAAALEATDYCLQQCNLLGIKIIANFSGNYTYETEGSKFWYCTANGVSPDAEATQFFTNSTIINSFKAHITFCLNHVNQYTGIAYKDDPAVLAWGTGGEMSVYPLNPEWPYYAWTDAISTHIKVTCGAQQLVADGHCAIRSDQQDGVIDTNSLDLAHVDMYQLHPYSHWTPPRYAHQEGKIAHAHGKAFFIGEFPWQGTEPDTSTPTIWTATELMSQVRGSTYVDGIQMWELLAPNVTFGGGYTLHWPTPDNSSGHGIALETARGRQMAANNLAMASGKVAPSRLVSGTTAWATYNSAAYRGGGFNFEGITDWIPLTADTIVVFGASQGVSAVASAPAGWVNPLGANVGVSSASHTLACMYHVVTAADEAAVNVSYVIANMFTTGSNGDGSVIAVRGLDPSHVVDAFNTASGTASTTHVLPSLSTSVHDDSMVLACVSSFANNAYTVPVGTGEAGASNGHQGLWVGVYDDFTTAGVGVPAKNITAVNSDVYASITLALTGL